MILFAWDRGAGLHDLIQPFLTASTVTVSEARWPGADLRRAVCVSIRFRFRLHVRAPLCSVSLAYRVICVKLAPACEAAIRAGSEIELWAPCCPAVWACVAAKAKAPRVEARPCDVDRGSDTDMTVHPPPGRILAARDPSQWVVRSSLCHKPVMPSGL